MHSNSGIAIVTVHGTNLVSSKNSGQDKTAKPTTWWGKDGLLAASIVNKLESTDGSRIEIIPFEWCGSNTDKARNLAAKHFRDYVRFLRQKYTQIHVVAHSHGGNVVYNSIKKYYTGQDVSFLDSITSVGTSFFIRSRSYLRLFYRAYIKVLITFFLSIIFLPFFILLFKDIFIQEPTEYPIAHHILLLVPILFLFLMFINPYITNLASKSRIVAPFIANRWLIVIDKNDEIFRLLNYSSKHNNNLLTSYFFFNNITFPIIVVYFGLVFIIMTILVITALGGDLIINLINIDFRYLTLKTMGEMFYTPDENWQMFHSLILYDVIVAMRMLGRATLAIAILCLLLDTVFFGIVNRTIRSLLRKPITGEDMREKVTGASPVPAELGYSGMSFLPEAWSAELLKAANEEISRSITDIRLVILQLLYSHDFERAAVNFEEVITWGELVHNSYFNNSNIMHLILSHIVQRSDGRIVFRNLAFLND